MTSLNEKLRAHNIIAERNYKETLKIIREMNERVSGNRHALKGHVVITTEKMLKDLEDTKKVTEERKKRKIDKEAKKTSKPSASESVNASISLEQKIFYSNENMERIMSK